MERVTKYLEDVKSSWLEAASVNFAGIFRDAYNKRDGNPRESSLKIPRIMPC